MSKSILYVESPIPKTKRQKRAGGSRLKSQQDKFLTETNVLALPTLWSICTFSVLGFSTLCFPEESNLMKNFNHLYLNQGEEEGFLRSGKCFWAMEKDAGERNQAYSRPLVDEWMGVELVNQTQNLGTTMEYRGWTPKKTYSFFPWEPWASKTSIPQDNRGIPRDNAVIRFSVIIWRAADRDKKSYKYWVQRSVERQN